MKLRVLALTNVRRFAAQTVRLEEIGDGITVFAAPNESGKSTFFDALHALFFQPHGSRAREVRSLQPHSGGAVTVAAEIDTEDGRFRLEKTWLSRKGARVFDAATGRLIAQDDEAEAWIGRVVAGGLGGPAGLLWVRQGAAGLEPSSGGAADKRAWQDALEARRGLMSTLAVEIDAMTGGRRMDHVLAACRAELSDLATATGRPRSGGPWKQAEEAAEGLRAECADLEAKVAELGAALAERRRAEDERARLDAPDECAAREAALSAARARMQAADDHAEKLYGAESVVRIAMLERDAAANGRAGLDALQDACAAAAEAGLETARQEAEAAEAHRAAREEDAQAAKAHATAETVVTGLRENLEAARKAAEARAAAGRLAEVQRRLDQAEAQARIRVEAEARLRGARVDDSTLSALEAVASEVERLRAQRDALAVTVMARYEGAMRVAVDGAELAEAQPVALHGTATLALPGIGSLTVDTGGRGADRQIAERLATAEADLQTNFDAAGVRRLSEARAAHAARVDAAGRLHMAEQVLASLAPRGLEALQAEVARLRLLADGGAEDVELDPEAQAESLKGALAAFEAAASAREAARARLGAAETRLAEARTANRLAETRRGEAEAARGSHEAHAARRARAAGKLAAAQARLDAAVEARDALAATAPDVETVCAELDRAEGAARATDERIKALSDRLLELDGLIRARAEDGVEERLADLRGRLQEAEARADRYGREAAALQRLETALEEARRAARDTYFEPLKRELLPLLTLIHDEADLTLDDASLLPAALTRDGQEETMEILSGGTAEQIAILSRLAFAKLFAKAGQSVPVILDDALVHSDDDRIERMFTALHRVAGDQQILVFTCRSRVFSRLGGQAAVFSAA
ncbi:AAA domain-containing protein [Rhodovulum sp. ES.010]|uniref:AAA family ATPase n=1 Tax=Rhodovulum sp. ES.010 TaxID=1882821 RepID=UPI0009258E3A|nr:ATP-binding protein [Rhodovulum sp. ES.010]SIO09880.1 AAA domain-containing protein [Rhodovulum sp. ES.010]